MNDHRKDRSATHGQAAQGARTHNTALSSDRGTCDVVPVAGYVDGGVFRPVMEIWVLLNIGSNMRDTKKLILAAIGSVILALFIFELLAPRPLFRYSIIRYRREHGEPFYDIYVQANTSGAERDRIYYYLKEKNGGGNVSVEFFDRQNISQESAFEICDERGCIDLKEE